MVFSAILYFCADSLTCWVYEKNHTALTNKVDVLTFLSSFLPLYYLLLNSAVVVFFFFSEDDRSMKGIRRWSWVKVEIMLHWRQVNSKPHPDREATGARGTQEELWHCSIPLHLIVIITPLTWHYITLYQSTFSLLHWNSFKSRSI